MVGGYRSPRLRDIGLAILALLAGLLIFLHLADVVKLAGSVLLIVPSALGVVHRATGADVRHLNLASLPPRIELAGAGRYSVYTADYDLLTISDTIEESNASPWLTVELARTGEQVPLSFMGRGLRPYDTPLARGRPVLTFLAPAAGLYELTGTRRNADIYLVRDYVTGREKVIVLAYWGQLALIGVVLFLAFGRSRWRRWQAHKADQRARREEAELFWQRHRTRRRTEDDNQWRPKS